MNLDKFSLGLSMFYGYHVLTDKLFLSVSPQHWGLNAKTEPYGEQSLRETRIFWCPPSFATMRPVEPSMEKAARVRISTKDSDESHQGREIWQFIIAR